MTDLDPIIGSTRPLAVVTGGAGAIGTALARRCRDRGHDVLLVDVDGDALQRAAGALGAASAVANAVVDVSSSADVAALADAIPVPDVLCLNAGITGRAPGAVWETPEDDWDRVLAVNLAGVANGLRAFVPRMLAAGGPRRIVITSSLAGLLCWPGGGSYGVSKHAVTALAEQTALSLLGTGIEVAVVFPALVRSGMSAEGIEADDLADDVFAAIDAGLSTYVPPEWRPAVAARGERIASGRPPEIASPSA
jgi:NAD(P)-dependent dehydrogenase (short-subunit alcohol dehydrogenase family)